MRWYDYAGIGLALVLALWADHDAASAQRAAVLAYLHAARSATGDLRWIRSFDLKRLFGQHLTSLLHRLEREGLVDREESNDPITSAARGGYADVRYRARSL